MAAASVHFPSDAEPPSFSAGMLTSQPTGLSVRLQYLRRQTVRLRRSARTHHSRASGQRQTSGNPIAQTSARPPPSGASQAVSAARPPAVVLPKPGLAAPLKLPPPAQLSTTEQQSHTGPERAVSGFRAQEAAQVQRPPVSRAKKVADHNPTASPACGSKSAAAPTGIGLSYAQAVSLPAREETFSGRSTLLPAATNSLEARVGRGMRPELDKASPVAKFDSGAVNDAHEQQVRRAHAQAIYPVMMTHAGTMLGRKT